MPRSQSNQPLVRQPGDGQAGAGPGSDPVFEDLFPSLVVAAAGPCDCGGDHEDEAPVLRPYQPVPASILAEFAAGTVLVEQARALAEWVGAERALTPSGLLRAADAAQVVLALGLGDPAPVPGKKPRNAKDLPELHALWTATVEAGLIDDHGASASTAAAASVWRDGEPQQKLDSWARLLAGHLRLRAVPTLGWEPVPQDEVLAISAQYFYTLARDPIPAALPALVMIEDVGDDLNPLVVDQMLVQLPGAMETAAQEWVRAGVLAPAEPDPDVSASANALLADLGAAMSQPGDPPGLAALMVQPLLGAVTASPVVQVTPLGAYGLRRLLLAHGWLVPQVGDLAEVPAEDLLEQLTVLEPQDAVVEVGAWLAARGQEWPAALDAVVASAGTKDLEHGPVRRAALLIVLHSVGPDVEPLLDLLAGDPWLSATAAHVRHGLGLGPVPTLGQELWLAIDALSMALDGDEEEQAELVAESETGELLKLPGAIPAAVGLSHPLSRDVLQLVADFSDDRPLAQRVRRALAAGSARGPAKGRSKKKHPGRRR